MKITNVRAVQPIAENSPPDWRTSMGQILIAIDTDQGLTGYGVGGGGKAGIHVVEAALRDLLLDQSPEPVEELWQRMYQATLPYGRKGLAIMALSGVDLALWDLRGKANRTSVVELLGGKPETEIPTYCTVWNEISPEQSSQHSAFKLHIESIDPSQRPTVLAEAVGKARDAIGPDCLLMIDAWMKWDIETTLSIAEKLTPYNVAWIEEPLPPDDLNGYAILRDRCPIPIAGGEHECTAVGFAELIDHRLHQILQPDVCWCGGMTELIKIYQMAKKAGLRVCPHRGAELWSLPAIAALDDQPLAESGRPWMTWVGGQPPIRNGIILPSEAPGLGVIIDEDNLPI